MRSRAFSVKSTRLKPVTNRVKTGSETFVCGRDVGVIPGGSSSSATAGVPSTTGSRERRGRREPWSGGRRRRSGRAGRDVGRGVHSDTVGVRNTDPTGLPWSPKSPARLRLSCPHGLRPGVTGRAVIGLLSHFHVLVTEEYPSHYGPEQHFLKPQGPASSTTLRSETVRPLKPQTKYPGRFRNDYTTQPPSFRDSSNKKKTKRNVHFGVLSLRKSIPSTVIQLCSGPFLLPR